MMTTDDYCGLSKKEPCFENSKTTVNGMLLENVHIYHCISLYKTYAREILKFNS